MGGTRIPQGIARLHTRQRPGEYGRDLWTHLGSPGWGVRGRGMGMGCRVASSKWWVRPHLRPRWQKIAAVSQLGTGPKQTQQFQRALGRRSA